MSAAIALPVSQPSAWPSRRPALMGKPSFWIERAVGAFGECVPSDPWQPAPLFPVIHGSRWQLPPSISSHGCPLRSVPLRSSLTIPVDSVHEPDAEYWPAGSGGTPVPGNVTVQDPLN